ncbi:hypothetical protein [Streptomyces rochei]|uniref:Uncharacterized protein n=1 Tax=Streptomyces rochei TaxID=1928 RepID=A0ABW7E2M1_STRRO
MASNTVLPKWAWDLVIAMLNHEDEHGDDSRCLEPVLSAVPVEIRNHAEAIRSYVRAAQQGVVKERAEATWGELASIFAGQKSDQVSKP